MKTSDFATTLLVDQSPEEAFNAINNVRGWWSENIVGSTDTLNSEFDYRYKDVHRSKMKIVELVHGQKIVWLAKENYFDFTKDKTEWTGTKIVFEIAKEGNQTQVSFTHIGLVPQIECFGDCSKGWRHYLQGSLLPMIATGNGHPNRKAG